MSGGLVQAAVIIMMITSDGAGGIAACTSGACRRRAVQVGTDSEPQLRQNPSSRPGPGRGMVYSMMTTWIFLSPSQLIVDSERNTI